MKSDDIVESMAQALHREKCSCTVAWEDLPKRYKDPYRAEVRDTLSEAEVVRELKVVAEEDDPSEGSCGCWMCEEHGPYTGFVSVRSAVLDSAKTLVNGDRENEYGTPGESLGRIAEEWSLELGVEVTPVQVARMMIRLKLSRAVHTPHHMDSWVDLAGYAALAAEVAQSTPPPPPVVPAISVAEGSITAYEIWQSPHVLVPDGGVANKKRTQVPDRGVVDAEGRKIA